MRSDVPDYIFMFEEPSEKTIKLLVFQSCQIFKKKKKNWKTLKILILNILLKNSRGALDYIKCSALFWLYSKIQLKITKIEPT